MAVTPATPSYTRPVVARREKWSTLIRAVEAEPLDLTTVRGASGISHPVIAAGVDERRHRLILISGEHDARAAAVAQADIEAAAGQASVLVARPVAINLAPIARTISETLGRFNVKAEDLQKLPTGKSEKAAEEFFKPYFEPLLAPMVAAFQTGRVNVPAQVMQLVQQLGVLRVAPREGEDEEGFVIDLQQLASLDPIQADRDLGVCPIPIYELNEAETEALDSGQDVDEAREILRRRDLLQYFFPAPDHVALGLADRSSLTPAALAEHLESVPQIGHPFGPPEVVPPDTALDEVIDALEGRGFVVKEGEREIEVTRPGVKLRESIKFKPREGLVSKVINKVSITLDFLKLFGGGGG